MTRNSERLNDASQSTLGQAPCIAVSTLQRSASGKRRDFLPGGVSSNYRLGISPTPLVFDHAEGPYLFDVDGNQLIDYYLGMGPMILGHSPQVVRRCRDASSSSAAFSTPGRARLSLPPRSWSARWCHAPRWCASAAPGSEIVHAALRLARAATGREVID